eukprot:765749-Hanusia_phi.AAC.1
MTPSFEYPTPSSFELVFDKDVRKHAQFPPFPPEEASDAFNRSLSEHDASLSFNFMSHSSYQSGCGHISLAPSSKASVSEATRKRRSIHLAHVHEGSNDVAVMTQKFFRAALLGETDTLRAYILEQGVDVNLRAGESVEIETTMWEGINRTALHFACLADDDNDNMETVGEDDRGGKGGERRRGRGGGKRS